MHLLRDLLVTILDALFVFGMLGSIIVILWSGIEDFETAIEKEPAVVVHQKEP